METSDMKQIIFSALATVAMLSFISCERHSWEDSAVGAKDGTKRLYPKKEHSHGAEHKKHDDHDKKDGHGQDKAEH
jgi:hypothetical protein